MNGRSAISVGRVRDLYEFVTRPRTEVEGNFNWIINLLQPIVVFNQCDCSKLLNVLFMDRENSR